MNDWVGRPELKAYLARQRWFGESESEIAITEVRALK